MRPDRASSATAPSCWSRPTARSTSSRSRRSSTNRPVSGRALPVDVPDERARPTAHERPARGRAGPAHRGESCIRRSARGVFHAEFRPQGPTGERRRSVTSARNLSEVYLRRWRDRAGSPGDPVLFPDATVLAGERATEAALRQFAAPRMLHIATHGFFLQYAGGAPKAGATDSGGGASRDPLLRAGLAFARANVRGGSDQDDGLLTALEASRLNLWGTSWWRSRHAIPASARSEMATACTGCAGRSCSPAPSRCS